MVRDDVLYVGGGGGGCSRSGECGKMTLCPVVCPAKDICRSGTNKLGTDAHKWAYSYGSQNDG